MDRLLTHVAKGELNPAYLATHRFSLEDGPRGYDMFKHKTDGCVRAVQRALEDGRSGGEKRDG